ncbi:MAG: hypothetical protein Q4D71_13290, partial [Oscillospiraceae bacterium]|nr:hypothetical protein [Oscillospiraceae bacterium]
SNFEVSSEFRMARYFAVNISYTQDNLNLNRETISFGVALGADFRPYDNLPKQNFFIPEEPAFFPKLNASTTWREMGNNYSFNIGLEIDNLKWNVLDIFEINSINQSYQYDSETGKNHFTIGVKGTF